MQEFFLNGWDVAGDEVQLQVREEAGEEDGDDGWKLHL